MKHTTELIQQLSGTQNTNVTTITVPTMLFCRNFTATTTQVFQHFSSKSTIFKTKYLTKIVDVPGTNEQPDVLNEILRIFAALGIEAVPVNAPGAIGKYSELGVEGRFFERATRRAQVSTTTEQTGLGNCVNLDCVS